MILFATLSLPAQTTQARLARIIEKPAAPTTAAELPAGETFRFAGKVVDAEGRPVAGAVLEVFVTDASPVIGGDLELKEKLTTGAEGSFDLALPRTGVEAMVHKPGLAPAGWTQWNQAWTAVQDATNETLVLSTPAVLAGTVVDEADKPVASAEVWASVAYLEHPLANGMPSYAYLHGPAARSAFATRTGADGKFRFENFPASGAVDLGVTKPGKVLRPIAREHISPETLFHMGEEIKLVVESAGSIEGKVLAQQTGQPLAGFRFSLARNQPGYSPTRGMPTASSGADGKFLLADVAPGNYMVRATLESNGVPEWVAEPVAVTVEAGKTVRDVQFTAERGGFLKAVVLGREDMSFVPKASIQVNKGAYRVAGLTDPNGVALFRLPPGTYQVFANRGEARGEGTSLTIESGETNKHEFLLAPPPRLLGTVRDPAGQPAKGLPVSIVGSFYAGGAGAKTDEQGRFELPFSQMRLSGLNNAVPCLLVRDVERNLVAAQDLGGDNRPLDLKLQPGLVVVGRVEDASGKAIPSAGIQVYMEFGTSGMQFDPNACLADAQGRFELTALPSDRHYTVWANAKGFGTAYLPVEAADSASNRVELAALVLKRADQRLAGQVLDADDKPVPGIHVAVYGKDQPNLSARTDAQGRFKFDGVCEGAVQVSANGREATGFTSAQAGATDVVVRLGAQSVRVFRESPPPREALKGRALPDPTAVHLNAEACPAGKPVLLCLFDLEQRPSRRVLRALAEQSEALKQKGLTVLALQATVTSANAFKDWKEANPVPFPVGYVSEKSDKTRWATGVETLPWLILTDKEHRVTAEGFSLEELDTQLKALK